MDSLVLDNLTVAVMAIDKDFKITVANKMCKTILGIDPNAAKGRNIDEFFNHPPEFTRTVQHTLEQGKDFRYDVFPYTWGPYEKTLSQRSTLLKDENNEVIGAMIEFEDITEQHMREQDYRKHIEKSAINVIPLDKGVGMIVLHTLPFEVSPQHFVNLAAEAMELAIGLRLEYLILDASTISFVNMIQNLPTFKSIVDGFRLIGIEVILCGIQPEVAMQLINTGIDLSKTKIFPKMNKAIDFTRDQIDLTSRKNSSQN